MNMHPAFSLSRRLALVSLFALGSSAELVLADITITPEPGFDVTWDGNDGDHFDSAAPPAGAMAPDNAALAVNGGVPIASAESPFVPTHQIVNLNDGFYGNSNSHINGTAVTPAWSGIVLPGTFEITSFAFGRDNGNGEFDDSIAGTDACGGQCDDRWGAGGVGLGAPAGTYTVQITNNGGSTWTDIASITYDGAGGDTAPGGAFTPWLRHEFEVTQNGGALVADGLRLLLPGAANNVAIDEIEIYGTLVAIATLNPAEEGGVPAVGNLAAGGTAFAKDVAAGRSIASVNDETFGDASAWTGASANNFVGINLGADLVDLRSIAFGRDNTGAETDGWVGEYGLQITETPNPDESTPDGDWTTIATILHEVGDPQDGHLRHRFNFGVVMATGIRLLVPDGTVIDELEVYAEHYLPPPPPALTITAEPGFTTTWDGNDGDHFNQDAPPAGAIVPDNLALANNGGIPFASSPSPHAPTHDIAKLNDGFYGNANSHINGAAPTPVFFGIALPGETAITAIAWGRDNGNGAFDDSFAGSDACLGQCDDRSFGTYTIQVTSVPDPNELTAEQDWITVAILDYANIAGSLDDAPGGLFTEWLRHQYEIGVDGGGPIVATGVRILCTAANVAIDEIEIYGVAAPPDPPRLAVTREANGEITLTWSSKPGMSYHVRSETDPSASEPIAWPIFGGLEGIAGTPPENTVSFPLPAESMRLFVVEEFPTPPVSVLSDDFESGVGGWTVGSDGRAGTVWELGAPSVVGPTAANSGTNCFATNLSADYGFDANVWLRSPAIDLTNAVSATLCYFQYTDIEDPNPDVFDFGSVSVLDASDDSVLAVIETDITGFTNWQKVTQALPAAALGNSIKIEFRLRSDGDFDFPGWYLDDVSVLARN